MNKEIFLQKSKILLESKSGDFFDETATYEFNVVTKNISKDELKKIKSTFNYFTKNNRIPLEIYILRENLPGVKTLVKNLFMRFNLVENKEDIYKICKFVKTEFLENNTIICKNIPTLDIQDCIKDVKELLEYCIKLTEEKRLKAAGLKKIEEINEQNKKEREKELLSELLLEY